MDACILIPQILEFIFLKILNHFYNRHFNIKPLFGLYNFSQGHDFNNFNSILFDSACIKILQNVICKQKKLNIFLLNILCLNLNPPRDLVLVRGSMF